MSSSPRRGLPRCAHEHPRSPGHDCVNPAWPRLDEVAGPVPPQVSEVGGLTRHAWLFEAGDLAFGELEVDGGRRVVEVLDFGGR